MCVCVCVCVCCMQIGLAVIQCHEPMHYVSLFSHTHGTDVVLTMYDGNK